MSWCHHSNLGGSQQQNFKTYTRQPRVQKRHFSLYRHTMLLWLRIFWPKMSSALPKSRRVTTAAWPSNCSWTFDYLKKTKERCLITSKFRCFTDTVLVSPDPKEPSIAEVWNWTFLMVSGWFNRKPPGMVRNPAMKSPHQNHKNDAAKDHVLFLSWLFCDTDTCWSWYLSIAQNYR